MKHLLIALMTLVSVSAFSAEVSTGKKLTQEARERILAKLITAIEEETQVKCGEPRLTHAMSVADVELVISSITDCDSVRVKALLTHQRSTMGKIKVDF